MSRIPAFTLPQPADRAEWEARRVLLRATLMQLMGDLPPLFTPRATVVDSASRDGYLLEKIEFANGLDDTVYGYLLVPDQPNGAAVLYCHYHGGRYELGKDELFQEVLWEEWGSETPRGVALAQAGYIVLAIDSYAFGERQHQGPAGSREGGRETEHALFKQFLWEGRSLWSMMVYDDWLALNYLLSHPLVEPDRVAVTGASMGGSRATWLAALDERIKIAAPVIQYTRYQNLMASGGLNGHSFYYYVPGVLRAGLDMEALTALVAPRPQIALVGDQDKLSPADGITQIVDFTRAIYALYDTPDQFEPRVYAGVAHHYTTTMFADLLAFLEKYL